MKRKQDSKLKLLLLLVMAALNVVIMVISLFLNDLKNALWLGLFGYWVLRSYFTDRKNILLREVAIGLFNKINPKDEIGDEDWADFEIVEKDGKKNIIVTVHRGAEKEQQ